ncbi:MAG: hypothetical protein V7K21_16415 [Nostoc sp.]|uniref:hypothetical protein n=1 Tax=Nostoc sp. TaxID=1180 RepID=UPI002FFBE63D
MNWIHPPLNSVNESLNWIHPPLILVNESLNWIHPPLNSVNESLNWIHPPLILVNESLNWIHPPLNSVNETLNFPPSRREKGVRFFVGFFRCCEKSVRDVASFKSRRSLTHIIKSSPLFHSL